MPLHFVPNGISTIEFEAKNMHILRLDDHVADILNDCRSVQPDLLAEVVVAELISKLESHPSSEQITGNVQ